MDCILKGLRVDRRWTVTVYRAGCQTASTTAAGGGGAVCAPAAPCPLPPRQLPTKPRRPPLAAAARAHAGHVATVQDGARERQRGGTAGARRVQGAAVPAGGGARSEKHPLPGHQEGVQGVLRQDDADLRACLAAGAACCSVAADTPPAGPPCTLLPAPSSSALLSCFVTTKPCWTQPRLRGTPRDGERNSAQAGRALVRQQTQNSMHAHAVATVAQGCAARQAKAAAPAPSLHAKPLYRQATWNSTVPWRRSAAAADGDACGLVGSAGRLVFALVRGLALAGCSQGARVQGDKPS